MEPSLPRPSGGFATRAVHAANVAVPLGQVPAAPPVHLSAVWITEHSAEIGELLEDRREGYVYGRYDNPTATVLHAAVADLHGAEAAWSFASGTAAIHGALEATLGGGRILATDRLYGGTYALLERLRERSGWRIDRVDMTEVDEVERHLTDEHTVVYVETIANPSTTVADLRGLAALCRDRGVRLVVDNTFASPYLCRPLELGADLVVESATKYLGGHGDVVAGVVAGSASLIRAVRVAAYEYGAAINGLDAFLVLRGLQTLHLRVAAASRSAAAIAEALASNAAIEGVHYPGLASHPQHGRAAALFGGRGAGGMLAFEVASRERAEAFADACRVFARAASLGGTRSLVLHPASSSHRQLSDADLRSAGVHPGTVRLSVGIEDPSDLVADVERSISVATTR